MFGKPLMHRTQVPHKLIGWMRLTFVHCTLCGKCSENHCAECIDPHTWGGAQLLSQHNTCYMSHGSGIYSFGLMLCALVGKGLGLILVYSLLGRVKLGLKSGYWVQK